MVILTRRIDLSVAANVALTGMIAAMTNAAFPGLPVPAIVAMCAGIGAALGAIDGLLVRRLAIPPIVVTRGTLTIYRGTVFVISGGTWVNAHEMSPAFTGLPPPEVLGLPLLA